MELSAFTLIFTEVVYPQYEGILNKTELPAKKTRKMWNGEAFGMGLEERYQLLAVRKIVGKHQMSILPVSEVLFFYLIARNVIFCRNLAVRTMMEPCKNCEKNCVLLLQKLGKCTFDW